MLEAQAAVSLGRDFARALDPVLLARDCGIEPDSVQTKLLRTSSRKTILCCTRQWGKSTCAALIALHEALYAAPAMILCVSPSQPQSTELFKRIHDAWAKLRRRPRTNRPASTIGAAPAARWAEACLRVRSPTQSKASPCHIARAHSPQLDDRPVRKSVHARRARSFPGDGG
jgi:hypothetical protein